MSAESPWFSQNCKQLTLPWLILLPAGQRMAWIMLKNHVKTHAVSQKQPNRAYRLDPAIAAMQWNLSREDVEGIEAAAALSGELVIEGDCWFVTDRLAFQSERTAQRYATGEVCPTNADKPTITPPPCHATETETGTETREGETPKPPKPTGPVLSCAGSELPDGIDTPEVRRAIDEFLVYRANRPQKRAPMTPRGLELLIGQLSEFPPGDAVRRIEAAIVGNYLGVVFDSDRPRDGPKNGGRGLHDMKAEFLEGMRGK